MEAPDGEPLETDPRSILGWFFALFWYGSERQCSGDDDCTMCVFPAAAVIALVAWRCLFLVAAWRAARAAAAGLQDEPEQRRRTRAFQLLLAVLVVAGLAARGWGRGCVWWAPSSCLRRDGAGGTAPRQGISRPRGKGAGI